MKSALEGPEPSAVLSAFAIPGRCDELTALPGAGSHRVYRMVAGECTFAVKEMRNPWDEPGWQAWLDAAWRIEQLAFDSGIAMPEPVPNPVDGSCLAWVDRLGSGTPVPVRVHRWVDGRALGPGPVASEVARWAGEVLATLHGLGLPAADRDVFPVTGTGTADRWPELVEAAARARVSWATDLEAVLVAVRAIAELTRMAGHRPAEEVMTHGDLDQKNILVAATGPVLCDWDVAAPLVPRRELADVALSLADWRRTDIARDVLLAYRACGGDDTDVRPEDLGQPMMIGLDWIAYNVERHRLPTGDRGGGCVERAARPRTAGRTTPPGPGRAAGRCLPRRPARAPLSGAIWSVSRRRKHGQIAPLDRPGGVSGGPAAGGSACRRPRRGRPRVPAAR